MTARTDNVGSARPTRTQIDQFLSHRRFAAVGVSRNPKDFTRVVVGEFEQCGYEVVPVNPGASEINGQPCFARVQDVNPPVSAVLLLTPPAMTEQVVQDCHAAGVTHVWMYRGGGVGAVSNAAVAYCDERGIEVIAGECPLMFLPNPGFPHRVHGLIRKVLRTYPL